MTVGRREREGKGRRNEEEEEEEKDGEAVEEMVGFRECKLANDKGNDYEFIRGRKEG